MVNFVNLSSHKTTTGTNGPWKTSADCPSGRLRHDFLSRPDNMQRNKKMFLSACSASFCPWPKPTTLRNGVKSSIWLLWSYPSAHMFPSLASDAVPSLPFYIYSGKLKERHLYSINYPPKSISLLCSVILHRPCIFHFLCVLETLQRNRNIGNIHQENMHWSKRMD